MSRHKPYKKPKKKLCYNRLTVGTANAKLAFVALKSLVNPTCTFLYWLTPENIFLSCTATNNSAVCII